MAELLTKFPQRRTVLLASLLAIGMTATACSAPGEDRSSAPDSNAVVKTDLGTAPITRSLIARDGRA
ncbi:ABC transporter substrate-binding protein, partial [Micromonospora sp. LAH09]|nr:ABC transporter substrate-binding protein [Micromonospora cabrerizensis]